VIREVDIDVQLQAISAELNHGHLAVEAVNYGTSDVPKYVELERDGARTQRSPMSMRRKSNLDHSL
jgi:hypothetical protein